MISELKSAIATQPKEKLRDKAAEKRFDLTDMRDKQFDISEKTPKKKKWIKNLLLKGEAPLEKKITKKLFHIFFFILNEWYTYMETQKNTFETKQNSNNGHLFIFNFLSFTF